MLAEDIEAGHGNLRIRQSDARAFKLGVNIATTPGKVDLPQRADRAHPVRADDARGLQAPALDRAAVDQQILHPRPQSREVVHPLGGGAGAHRLRHLLGQSGRAPRRQGFRRLYARRHPRPRSTRRTGDRRARGRRRSAIASAERCSRRRSPTWPRSATSASTASTFFTALVDFTDAGDLKVFVDAEQLKAVEERMAEQGYLEGSQMANAFNMLRPNDLIWSYYVNNYLKGKEPMPFDLLVWNSDFDAHARRQPQVLSAPLLSPERSFQRAHGAERQDARPQESDDPDLRAGVARGPHRPGPRRCSKEPNASAVRCASCWPAPAISPASSTLPASRNISFGPDGPPEGEFEAWVAKAKETPGSWWPDWIEWIAAQAPEKVPARKPGEGKLKADRRRAGGVCER